MQLPCTGLSYNVHFRVDVMLSRYDVLVEYNECFQSPYIQELDDLVVSEKCTILEFESGGVTSKKLPPVQQVLHTK